MLWLAECGVLIRTANCLSCFLAATTTEPQRIWTRYRLSVVATFRLCRDSPSIVAPCLPAATAELPGQLISFCKFYNIMPLSPRKALPEAEPEAASYSSPPGVLVRQPTVVGNLAVPPVLARQSTVLMTADQLRASSQPSMPPLPTYEQSMVTPAQLI